MPWRQVQVMTERWQFVRDPRQRLVTFTELCALYGISRVTGYKWLHRAEQSGLDFLQEQSRRPHVCPHATPPALTARLLETRRHHPSWGRASLSSPTKNPTTFGPSSGRFTPFRSSPPDRKCPFSAMFRREAFRRTFS